MTDILDIIPLITRTEPEIRADMNASANFGLLPDDPKWVDTREVSMFYICTQPFVIEAARMYDRIGIELVAASNVATAWDEYLDLHGETYLIQRKVATQATGTVRFYGDNGVVIPTQAKVQPTQTDPDVPAPEYETTESGAIGDSGDGYVDLDVIATETGEDHNVGPASITTLNTSLGGVSSVTNILSISGGSDVESDEDYRARIQLQFAGKGSGTQADYKRWCLSYPGVGRCEVVVAAYGPGTVLVIVSDASGGELPTSLLDGLLEVLDPEPGQGKGLAPIGHSVSVATPTPVTADISADVVWKSGYSADGEFGTIPQRADVTAALAAYVNDQLGSGEDVVLEHVSARFFDVVGVYDISNVEINGAPENLEVLSVPAQVAQLGEVTLGPEIVDV